jgi:hypothetical protein
MQVAVAAQAAKERAQIKAEAAARTESVAVTYSQEMQVVIDHVKKTDARAAAAEQRNKEVSDACHLGVLTSGGALLACDCTFHLCVMPHQLPLPL